MKQLKIVIAEDSPVFSEMLRRTLSGIDGFSVVGKAANGIEAVRLVKELNPHVLVLDISMPLKNGIDALREIKQLDTSTAIIMFTAEQCPDIRKTCLEAGADFFLDKSQIIELMEICRQKLLAR